MQSKAELRRVQRRLDQIAGAGLGDADANPSSRSPTGPIDMKMPGATTRRPQLQPRQPPAKRRGMR
jgi:hypothetical protein